MVAFKNKEEVLNIRFKWICVILCAPLALWWIFSFIGLPGTLSKKSKLIDSTVTKLLLRDGINDTYLKQETHRRIKKGHVSFYLMHKEYSVPSRFSVKNFQSKLKSSLKDIRCELSKSQIDFGKDKNILDADISFKGYELFSLRLIQRLPVKKLTLKEPVLLKPHIPAYVAIVIDDWGYSMNNVEILRQIEKPLTLAILPGLPYSEKIAKEANKKNFEVILHLPLEPHNKNVGNEKDTIFTGMDKKEIISSLDKSIKSVPYIRGISNHQGSRATENEILMKTIFDELKKKKLFFLDSFVTPDSICESLARSTGIRFAKRSTFLDNEEDGEYIRSQLSRLAYLAKRDGSAIGICHDKQISLSVLKETMDEFEADGIKFVKLSELAK